MDRSNDSEALEGVVEIIERWVRSNGKPKTLKLRLHNHLVRNECFDMPELEAKIAEAIEYERKTKGKQQAGPLNEPPARLQREFESLRRVGATEAEKASPDAPKQLQGPVDRYGRKDLTEEQMQALVRWQQCALKAMRGPRVTTSWDATSGGGTRHGGVRDSDRLAFTKYHATRTRLPQEWGPVMDRLAEGAITAVEIGRWLVPDVKCEKQLRVAARGWVKSLAMILLDFEVSSRALDGPNVTTLDAQARRERGRAA